MLSAITKKQNIVLLLIFLAVCAFFSFWAFSAALFLVLLLMDVITLLTPLFFILFLGICIYSAKIHDSQKLFKLASIAICLFFVGISFVITSLIYNDDTCTALILCWILLITLYFRKNIYYYLIPVIILFLYMLIKYSWFFL